MRLAFAIALTMVAFAANSILTRRAIDAGLMDPAAFALVRVISGAVVLCLLVVLRRKTLPLLAHARIPGALSLALYLVGFSLAYQALDAGLGALILFGVVQIAMFAHGAVVGDRPGLRQLSGGGIAFAGLALALWPGAGVGTDPLGAALMVLAGLGWAAYSIAGRQAQDPLAATAANFLLCVPVLLLLLGSFVAEMSVEGVALGIVSGAVTSGLGYALWYRVLPQISGTTAAVVQLSVPIIALIAGALLLGEEIGASLMLASGLVIGGIALAVTARSAPADRR